jgi:type I restriction enzyme S subunit
MQTTLADVVTTNGMVSDGDWIESKDQDPGGGVRIIQLADIGIGRYLNKSQRFMTMEAANRLGCTFLKPGDLLLARMPDPIGRTCIFPGDERPSVTAVDVCIIRSGSSQLDRRWLCHKLNSVDFLRRVARDANGTTRKRIPTSALKRIPFSLPDIEEQQRTTAILDQAEALGAKRRQALAKLDILKQSLFLEMFGDPFSPPSNRRRAPLQDVVEAIFDCPHSTPTWTERGVRCLRTTNLGRGTLLFNDERFVSEATYQQRSRRAELRTGDIVLSREGTVGIAAVIPHNLRACMGQRLVQIRIDPDKVVPEYLLWYLLQVLRPDRISRVMVGSTAQHLNVKDLKKLVIPVPGLNDQRIFATRLLEIGCLERKNVNSLEMLNSVCSGLQHRAFQGEL